MANEPLRVAIIGTGKRSDYLYGPLLQAIAETELVAVWGRSDDSARRTTRGCCGRRRTVGNGAPVLTVSTTGTTTRFSLLDCSTCTPRPAPSFVTCL